MMASPSGDSTIWRMAGDRLYDPICKRKSRSVVSLWNFYSLNTPKDSKERCSQPFIHTFFYRQDVGMI